MSIKVRLAFPAICFGLGSWQLYRLRWKKQLLTSIEEGLALPPIDIDRLPESEAELDQIRFRRLTLKDIEYGCDRKDIVFVGPRTANNMFKDTNYASIVIVPAIFKTSK
jgi:cytochrome oxidase assembly protein ShyY1